MTKSFWSATAMVCLLASPVAAQTPATHPEPAEHKEALAKAELFAGYSLSRDDGETFNGFAASLNFNVNSWFGLGVETSGHYKSHDGVDLAKNSFLVGPRVSKRGGKVVPFAYVLGGIERSRVSIGSVAVSENDTAFAIGGGLDFEINAKWAFAIEGDQLLVRSHGDTHGTPRLSIGFVVMLGQK